MSEWWGFLSKFGAKMRITIENKATSNIPDVRKNPDLLSVFGLVNYLHQNYYNNSLTYHGLSLNQLEKKKD